MLPVLIGCLMSIVVALYIVIAPIYFYSIQKDTLCKYARESMKIEHKEAFKHGLTLLACSTVGFLFISIAVELASR